MKDLLTNSIQKNIGQRRQNIDQLDDRVVEFSRQLVKDEVREAEFVIDNDYFMKTSDPDFGRLSPPEQMLYLALWSLARTRSVPGNRFSFECPKEAAGATINFFVCLQAGKSRFKLIVLCGASPEAEQRLRNLEFPILNFSAEDLWNRAKVVAEQIFEALEEQVEKARVHQDKHNNGFIRPWP